MGKGVDAIHPEYAQGGPPPIGAQKANLDPFTFQIFREFGLEEVGHIRAIRQIVGGIPRPLLDLRPETIGGVIQRAIGRKNTYEYSKTVVIIASYLFPYMGCGGYVGTNPYLKNFKTPQIKQAQEGVIRTLLYRMRHNMVEPYGITVADFTNKISKPRNEIGRCGIKDEGICVPPKLGAKKRTKTNIISTDAKSLSYTRSQREILRVTYGTGSECKPGGFFPECGNGKTSLIVIDMYVMKK